MSYPSAPASTGAAATTRAIPATGATAKSVPTISSTVAPAARAASTLRSVRCGGGVDGDEHAELNERLGPGIERASRSGFRLSHQGGPNG